MDVDVTTPLALAIRYIEQDQAGWKVLIQDVPPHGFMDLLQESLMWNARFMQRLADIEGRPAADMARDIIANTKMRILNNG